MSVRRELVATPVEGTLTLSSYDSGSTPLVESKEQAKKELEALGDRLFDLHELLFANADRSVLVVLQGTDASGKNGTIKHVINRMNPAGVSTTEFEEPTETEADHHFLWRIEQGLPKPGHLAVFSRSHYEDVIVPAAEQSLGDDAIDKRIEEILDFESRLTKDGTVVVKCMLHISYDEQRRRFLRRLRRDDKRWKFDPKDIETRRKWDEYRTAYGDVLARSTTDVAPWYIIPSDHKWYRNWAVAKILVETMDEMDMTYPQPDFDIDALREALDD